MTPPNTSPASPTLPATYVPIRLARDGPCSSDERPPSEGGLPSVREDVTVGLNIKTLNERVGGGLKPIAVDEGVLEYMDQMKRVQFLNDWKAALGR